MSEQEIRGSPPARFRPSGVLVDSLLLSFVLALCSCTAEQYARQADRTGNEVLGSRVEETLGDREETVLYPEENVEGDGSEEPDGAFDIEKAVDQEQSPVRPLSLGDALGIAVVSNREFKARREDLFTTALGLISVGHVFSPQVAMTLGYVFAGDDLLTDEGNGPKTQDSNVSASVSQLFPYGTSVSVAGGTSLFKTNDSAADDRTTYDSSLAVRLTQPLLRGFGREVTMEPLVQAERDMVYTIRDFELFREQFSIDIASDFYALVGQQQAIENSRQNLEALQFDRRQAEALFAVDRTTELDVLRARRSELNSKNALIESEEGFELALDRFKIRLGLDTSQPIEIRSEAPDFVPVNYDVESAIAVALENRLDLMNRKEQLEDSYRSVRLARDNLLPNLDLELSYNVSSGPGGHFANQGTNRDSYSAGVTMEVPLDRVNQRNAYRRTQISADQAKRSYDQFVDNLLVNVRSSFRELTRLLQSLEIQEQLIVDQEKNVKIAKLRFELGEFSNRDVVEARRSLLDARNSFISESVNYEIARLQLLRELGILFVDEQGMFKK